MLTYPNATSPVTSLGPLLDLNSMHITHDSDKVKALNKIFHSFFTADDGILPNFPLRSDVITDILVFPPIEIGGTPRHEKL